MKKTAISIILMLIALLPVASVLAAEGKDRGEALVTSDQINYDNSPINKLGRGVINVATCWAEIPAKIADVSKKRDPVLGFTLGLAEGIVSTVVRGATGVFDAATFFVKPYDKPLMEPEYALTEADDKLKAALR